MMGGLNCWSSRSSVKRTTTRRLTKCVCPAVIMTMAAIVLATWLLNMTALPRVHPQYHSSTRSLIALRLRNVSELRLNVFAKGNLSGSSLQQQQDFFQHEEQVLLSSGELELRQPPEMPIDEEQADHEEEEQGSMVQKLKKSLQSQQRIVEWSEKEQENVSPRETDISQQQQVSVTIFSAPLAYNGEEDEPKRQALLSWLHLSPRPRVILLGNHSSLHETSREFAGLVSVEAEIDYSFNGLPMLHSIFARAHAAAADVTNSVSVLVGADVVLLQDIMPALCKMSATFIDDWMLMSRWLAIEHLPFRFVHKGEGIVFLESTVTGEAVIKREMANYATGKLEEEGPSPALDLLRLHMWAWNVGSSSKSRLPLFSTPMPPFVFTGLHHDSWVLRSLLQDRLRVVVDATDALLCFNNAATPSTHVATSWSSTSSDNTTATTGTTTLNPTRTLFTAEEWQHIANAHSYHASFRNMSLPYEHEIPTPAWKLIACKEPPTIKLCISGANNSSSSSSSISCYCSSRRSPAMLPRNNITETSFLESWEMKKSDNNNSSSSSSSAAAILSAAASNPNPNCSSSFSHSLDQLLPRVADSGKSVVLVAATVMYKEMLLSFVCRAKSLGVRNLLVAALDEKLYEYAFLQSLPVFYARSRSQEKKKKSRNSDSSSSSNNSSSHDRRHHEAGCSFGTECFRRTTKLKSQTVLQILKKGYNVLWSDVDIVWFRNPLPYLTSFAGAGTLAVQSDEPDMRSPANACERINSGFYYARADVLTIAAFSDIVEHAKTTDMSEQPSFNHVLCGKRGQNRVRDSQCDYKNGLRVLFLDRLLFPNGLANGYWWYPNVTEACASNGCYVLHNNWISKMENKVNRQFSTRLWFYDVAGRMCIHSWNAALAFLDNERFVQKLNASAFS